MTVSPPADDMERGPGSAPDDKIPSAPWRPVVMAGAAVLATVGVTGGILGAVAGVADPAAPQALPPGPREKGGLIDTVPGSTEEASEAAGDRAGGRGDTRPSPDGTAYLTEPDPEWLDRVSAATGIPRRGLQGYAEAQLHLMAEQPDCRISWPTLAAVGSVESHHGTYAGGELGSDGRTSVEVIGIPLDGSNNTVAIRDTDGGELDGDTEWDRAVGPMQFIPTTWDIWAADANGDGTADPHNIDDASLSAARYLCAEGRDLTTSDGWWSAILSYNESEDYAEEVLGIAKDYAYEAG
ncbi:hypothetical protein HDA32_004909 [Spinactinospora alkalitolerans]|uniref:Transglycosylase SLT domain-containing protein n=1 Tax=Spinactinospora alkalitolerans TaxID=687207 RepID=A0A852U0M6_9ACTN|nr:lytic murein transglycosylase [Spinactinospora alkalitolerans]NYE49789.1 hypothetical protein [Spinactinospora alkalitolerans]